MATYAPYIFIFVYISYHSQKVLKKYACVVTICVFVYYHILYFNIYIRILVYVFRDTVVLVSSLSYTLYFLIVSDDSDMLEDECDLFLLFF